MNRHVGNANTFVRRGFFFSFKYRRPGRAAVIIVTTHYHNFIVLSGTYSMIRNGPEDFNALIERRFRPTRTRTPARTIFTVNHAGYASLPGVPSSCTQMRCLPRLREQSNYVFPFHTTRGDRNAYAHSSYFN